MHCYCGRIAQLKTSWTSNNPGRHFQTCASRNGENGVTGCQFFMWVDPPMYARVIAIIPGLLRKLKARDEEIHGLKKRTRMMGALLFLMLVFLL
ncbi:DNA-(apurinic or apyrimidinic site) lyase [Handroanthus impetiginosus]|uniref:DNA-(Apurinic or apyrimidinic site) lyase n=1 Tax=Handroanthus impetiginosus TaxID=429701 RepID=A0A2G9GAU2_9LAMI|nr:DNA-(apurinic or apyrimidinic site) lyase [Handroanthus impetiginosus]